MTNDVSPTSQVDEEQKTDITAPVTELSEDMVMVSPGTMLREARKALSLSQEFISSKLNLKVGLVQDIEDDSFDPSMPVTFNRGYLANYAKLVGVEVKEVLASYDALNAATIQRTEMLSFSKETTKQAEHSRVMWLSYLIVAVLIGLTILWWLQESKQQAEDSSSIIQNTAPAKNVIDDVVAKSIESTSLSEDPTLINNDAQPNENKNEAELALDAVTKEPVIDVNSNADTVTNEVSQIATATATAISTAVFTFKGDCWVNIYDATGERIAWGVKKAGYVMTIQGKEPLLITVGKPELTSIIFNGQPVDMSAFNVGNIAKFNLPIVE